MFENFVIRISQGIFISEESQNSQFSRTLCNPTNKNTIISYYIY